MPIEIRELNIRVSVTRSEQEQESTTAPGSVQSGAPDMDGLITECVEQVMELLRLRNER
ncbi:MAG: hypothetical protein GXY53_09590 [Desulfobulbus sp.]|nr:hypothetical protein [Desulfobulbus sp.]